MSEFTSSNPKMGETDETFDYEEKLDLIPSEPGCYLMKDRRGEVVYIGKAKDLYDRVRSYFQSSGDNRMFVERLPYILADIETIITANEKEALILENTLIKKHKPRFNVRLKDDKNFLSLRIDTDREWPKVDIVREQKDDDAIYFGPYQSATAIRRTTSLLNKHFQLRTCPDTVMENRDRPCLQHQIDRCPAPCVGKIDRDDYMEHVDEALMFLEGKGERLVEQLEDKMYEASNEQDFELAAHYRDQIKSIQKVMEQQMAVNTDQTDRDVFGYYREGERLTIQVLTIRDGKLQGTRSFDYADQAFPDAEIISSFLNLYYDDADQLPREVLLPLELPESEIESFESLLSDKAGRRVYLKTPKRGEKRRLIETANTNAEHTFEETHAEEERIRDVQQKLKDTLQLEHIPERVECFDVSNLQGTEIVASKVLFEDGKPEKSGYRRYKIKDVDTQDDFASMREALMRRFRKIAEGDEEPPDLTVIDGGKGQLGQATAVFEDLGLHTIDVISIAKERKADDGEVGRPERLFLPGRKNPVVLKENSAESYFLQRIRDEAHRFAIEYHKKRRRKQTLRSSLEDIQGVGKKTKRDLLRHFGSLKAIKKAGVDELAEVSGVGEKTARDIREYYEATR